MDVSFNTNLNGMLASSMLQQDSNSINITLWKMSNAVGQNPPLPSGETSSVSTQISSNSINPLNNVNQAISYVQDLNTNLKQAMSTYRSLAAELSASSSRSNSSSHSSDASTFSAPPAPGMSGSANTTGAAALQQQTDQIAAQVGSILSSAQLATQATLTTLQTDATSLTSPPTGSTTTLQPSLADIFITGNRASIFSSLMP